jgi:hypothetical protein
MLEFTAECFFVFLEGVFFLDIFFLLTLILSVYLTLIADIDRLLISWTFYI